MEPEFVNLTPENLQSEHLCCIIRTKKAHPGVEAKRKWLADRLREGHVFRKANIKGCAFIEYAPIESAWVPIEGDNFLYVYCLWVQGDAKGHGYGRSFTEYCINDAKERGMSGVCMLGAAKQKAWLSDQNFARKFGFRVVDVTDDGYELLALSFDGKTPRFAPNAKKQSIDDKRLTVYFDDQCPYIRDRVEKLREYCDESDIPANFVYVDSLETAKNLPCVFNNWAVFYDGKFVTVNQIDAAALQKIMKAKGQQNEK